MELLSKLKQEGSEFLSNNEAEVALNELEILFKALEKSRCIDRVVFDLSLARGLDYYTGVIFEAVFKGATQVFFFLKNLCNTCFAVSRLEESLKEIIAGWYDCCWWTL